MSMGDLETGLRTQVEEMIKGYRMMPPDLQGIFLRAAIRAMGDTSQWQLDIVRREEASGR